jgi:hypothetical protein
MSSTKDYIPKKLADFDLFQNKLMGIIAQHVPSSTASWGFLLADFTALQTLQTAWSAAYAAANPASNKKTRTTVQTTAMTTAKKNYTAAIRKFVKANLKENALVTNADRQNMGIPISKTTRTPSTAPTTTPQLSVTQGSGNTVLVKFTAGMDAKGVSKRAKPTGVVMVELRFAVGGNPPATPDDCPKTEIASRSPHKLVFSAADSGKRVYLYGRWLNNRKVGGPFTPSQITVVVP